MKSTKSTVRISHGYVIMPFEVFKALDPKMIYKELNKTNER